MSWQPEDDTGWTCDSAVIHHRLGHGTTAGRLILGDRTTATGDTAIATGYSTTTTADAAMATADKP